MMPDGHYFRPKNIIFVGMKEFLQNIIGRIIPFFIFMALIPLSVTYVLWRGIMSLIRKIFRR